MLDNVVEDATFMKRIIIGDEMWVYGYNDINFSTIQLQKRAKIGKTTSKIVFFDYRGLILHEFFPQVQKVNNDYYLAVLRHLHETKNSWIFQHNNTLSNSSIIVTELAPYDFFLFLPSFITLELLKISVVFLLRVQFLTPLKQFTPGSSPNKYVSRSNGIF